jgi:hypothetical protein
VPAIKGPREWWDSYAMILPLDVGADQYTETKRAFVCGMLATLDSLAGVGEELSDDEGADFLDRYRQTLFEIVDEMKAGESIQ